MLISHQPNERRNRRSKIRRGRKRVKRGRGREPIDEIMFGGYSQVFEMVEKRAEADGEQHLVQLDVFVHL